MKLASGKKTSSTPIIKYALLFASVIVLVVNLKIVKLSTMSSTQQSNSWFHPDGPSGGDSGGSSFHDNVFTPSVRTAIETRNKKFVVWMFPFPPPTKKEAALVVGNDETLVCPYTNACPSPQHHQQEQINLRALTENTFYENYVRDHAWHKLRHWVDFSAHIHVITIISLLHKYPGSYARTWGSTYTVCNPNVLSHQLYDPYEDGGADEFPIQHTTSPSSSFPIELLRDAPDGNSLVPDMTAERFAIYGLHQLSEQDKETVKGRYNSGNDVQWFASAHWMPFISDVRHFKDALLDNYTGYLIGNALSNYFKAPELPKVLDVKAMKKFSMMSIFSNMKLIEDNKDYYQRYTDEVEPFGSRSTVTHRELLDRKIKAYFSACMTLTTSIQGAPLSNPQAYKIFLNGDNINKPIEKTPDIRDYSGIIMVDVALERTVPESIRQRALHLRADIPKGYPHDAAPYKERMGYAYKLLSRYAREDTKVIITSRIHVGLPALGLGIPVIFIKGGDGRLPGGHFRTGRVSGLIEMFHLIDLSANDTWSFGDWTDASPFVVPPNPGNHAADRYRASFWNRLKRTSDYYVDTAKLFGMIPFQRRGLQNVINPDIHNTFHFVLEAEDLNHWQTKRAMELVFYYHPDARVYVHTSNVRDFLMARVHVNTPNGWDFLPGGGGVIVDTFVESGYDLVVQQRRESSVLSSSPEVIARDIVNTFGGVLLSKNVFLQRDVPVRLSATDSIVGTKSKTSDGLGMMIIGSNHDGDAKQHQLQQTKSWGVTNLSAEDTHRCLREQAWTTSSSDKDSVAVVLDWSTLVETNDVTLDTVCYSLLEATCIYCDEVHVRFD